MAAAEIETLFAVLDKIKKKKKTFFLCNVME
jgi:hypothetical protein